MTPHELMIDTDRYLIKGFTLTEPQKENIVHQLLAAKSGYRTDQNFYRDGKRRMYPEFFIPPLNDGKKLKTLYNQTPLVGVCAYQGDTALCERKRWQITF